MSKLNKKYLASNWMLLKYKQKLKWIHEHQLNKKNFTNLMKRIFMSEQRKQISYQKYG